MSTEMSSQSIGSSDVEPCCCITCQLQRWTEQIIEKRSELEIERYEMSRLTEKLKMAGGVAGRQTARIEAKADAIIAREPELEKQTDNAFALHDALLNDAAKGLDALERELALVSNDPLESSGASAEAVQGTSQTFRAGGNPSGE